MPSGQYFGQRSGHRLVNRVNAADTIFINSANLRKLAHFGETPANITSIALNANGGEVLLEWDGQKWNLLYVSAAGVTVV
jgi:hypothetical protein